MCLRPNHIYKSNVIFKKESVKVMALTGWDAEELLEELVGGVDDDGQGEEQVNHKEDLRRSFHLHHIHLQAAFRKAKIIKRQRCHLMSYWSSAQRVDYVGFHQAVIQIKARRITCILFSKMKGLPLRNTSVKVLKKYLFS